MKATLFAAVLSLTMISLPATAITVKNPPLSSTEQTTKQINLNTASAGVLAKSFKGIGKKRAEAIVDYRQNHGHFKSVAELSAVHGLGKSFVNKHLSELQAVFNVK